MSDSISATYIVQLSISTRGKLSYEIEGEVNCIVYDAIHNSDNYRNK